MGSPLEMKLVPPLKTLGWAQVVAAVAALAAGGITVCATIHSPSAAVFRQFDRLMMLLSGRLVYSGACGMRPAFLSQACMLLLLLAHTSNAWCMGLCALLQAPFSKHHFPCNSINNVMHCSTGC